MKFKLTPFPTLTTERLLLRQAAKADCPEILFHRSDAELNKYIKRPTIHTMEEAETFLNFVNTETEQNKSVFWVITLKGNDKMIGSISLWNFSEDLTVAETGYTLHQDFQKKGIMSEAMKKVLDYGFNTLGFSSIEAYTSYKNESSKNMLIKSGFVLQKNRKDKDDVNNIVFSIKK